MNIVISGLTAAGKTTHAKLLAEHLGYEYISASQLLAKGAGIDVSSSEHWWMTSGQAVISVRNQTSLDEEIDRELIARTNDADCQVFDAWGLPCTSNAPMLRIWLESDFPSRCRKCFVSHDAEVSFSECVEIVEEKDLESQRIFSALYGFDILIDREPFDIVVDLSKLIPSPTAECSQESISRADHYLQQAVARTDATSSTELRAAVGCLPPGSIIRGPGA